MVNMKLQLKDTILFLRAFDIFLREECKEFDFVEIGLIGGTALELFELRDSTKDIDIMFFTSIPEKIVTFLEIYQKEENIEIDYGMGGSFSSTLLNEEMFSRFSFVYPHLRINRFRKFRFKKLKCYMLNPEAFILTKLEAATKRGERDYNDALSIRKKFGVSKKLFENILQEYRPEIEMVNGMHITIENFIKDSYK